MNRGDGMNTKLNFVTLFSEIKEEDLRFLWEPYFLRGKLNIMQGDPNDGKSYMSLKIAADLSCGNPWPGETARHEPENALIITSEDGYGDTVKKRLRKLGADMDRVGTLKLEGTGEEARIAKRVLIDPDGLKKMAGAMAEIQPALVVLDPITSFLSEKVNMKSANEVRGALGYLAGLAEKYNTAVDIIAHMNKDNTKRPLYRVLGSIDFMAIVRSGVCVVKDHAGSTSLVTRGTMAHLKHNLSRRGDSIEYEIDDDSFRWGDATDATADDLMETAPVDITQTSRAMTFLRKKLGDEDCESLELRRMATEEGHNWSAVRRAQEKLGIKPKPIKDKETGRTLSWVWPRLST